MDKPDTYRQLFKEQLEQIQRFGAGHLFHDDLAEINDPVYFHEFMAQAAWNGLQYLGESDVFTMQDDAFSDQARQILARMEDSRVTREQYLDFITCRRFRQTLLCRKEIALHDHADFSAVEHFHISSQTESANSMTVPDGKPIERFTEARGGALQVGHPLGIRALHLLKGRWPATISFTELFQAASAEVSDEFAKSGEARSQLMQILLEAYRAGIVEFRRTPVRCSSKPSVRPVASRFARWQIARSTMVTTLRGENLRIEDNIGKRLLELLEGTRTRAELIQSLAAEIPDAFAADGDPNGKLEKQLQELARLALLED